MAARVLNGIIPACAGSTLASRDGNAEVEDHPRLRGEHLSALHMCDFSTGSSPLARGALLGLTDQRDGRGIIPACAGSTSSRAR